MKKNPVKSATLEQVEAKQAKAERFLRDVVGDSDKADEIAALSPQEYAERKKITINPKNGTRGTGHEARGRKNPDETAAAAEVYETFHGKRPEEILRVQEEDIGRDTYSSLGDLWEMKLNSNGDRYGLDFADCGVKLCQSADGRQLYVVGGDQNCDSCLPKDAPDKDFIIMGVLVKATYRTRKGFDKFHDSLYEHTFGEEGGEPPMVLYARTRKRLFIVGGNYRIEAPGIID